MTPCDSTATTSSLTPGATDPDQRQGPPSGLAWSLGRAGVAMISFSVALGVAVGVTAGTADRWGWPAPVPDLVMAALCTIFTAVGIGWLARRTHVTPAWLGLRRGPVGRDLGLGLLVVTAAATLVIIPAGLLGGVRFEGIDPVPLLLFLATTVVVATGLEAFPEELAFRGMAYSSLRERLRPVLTTIAATALFVLAPGLSTPIAALIIRLLGAGEPTWYRFAPAGEDPLAYLLLLIIWSLCLIQARQLTGSIWTAVAAHVMLLIINRTLLGSATGSGVSLSHPDWILIIPVYVIVAALGFTLLRGRLRAR